MSPLTEIKTLLQERGVFDAQLYRYDKRTKKVKIRKSLLGFRPEDVALILGLYYDGEEVVSHKQKKQSAFEDKYLNKIYVSTKMSSKENFSISFKRKDVKRTWLSYWWYIYRE